MTRRPAHPLFGLALVLLAACGGSSGGGPATPAATGGGPGASASAGSTQSGDGTGAGAYTGDVCSLLTMDEVRGAEQIETKDTVTTTASNAGCTWVTSDGYPVLGIILTSPNGKKQLKTYDTTDFESISNVGDQAFFQGSSSLMWMLVDDTLVNIHSGRVQNVDQARTTTTAIGKIVAARLRGQAVGSDLEVSAPPALNASSACDLITADALAGIVGKGAMTASGDPNLPQFCYFNLTSDGTQAVSIRLQRHSGTDAWDSTVDPSQTEAVSGIGDKAAWSDFDQSLSVLKADSIIQVTVLGLNLEGSASKPIAESIAKAALANL